MRLRMPKITPSTRITRAPPGAAERQFGRFDLGPSFQPGARRSREACSNGDRLKFFIEVSKGLAYYRFKVPPDYWNFGRPGLEISGLLLPSAPPISHDIPRGDVKLFEIFDQINDWIDST